MTMATGPEAPRTVTRCAARTEIPVSQFAALNALPDPIMPVSRRLCCELADGHRDAHLAFALASHGGVQWWWLRWGWRRHEVVAIDLCGGMEPDGPDPELCLFPVGHPGPHSFDLQPGPARDTAEPDAVPARSAGGTLRPDRRTIPPPVQRVCWAPVGHVVEALAGSGFADLAVRYDAVIQFVPAIGDHVPFEAG
jgi:hypothetical protein